MPFQTDAAMMRRASDRAINVDVIFPVLHGTFGEDGTIQGLLELADIPYVGAGVLGSAAGMDKDIMKSLFLAADAHREARHHSPQRVGERSQESPEAGREQAEVSGVREARESGLVRGHQQGARPQGTRPGHRRSRKFDRKIVIEQGVGGNKDKAREIECSVLGNDEPKRSVPGEIVPGKEFYDYTAKYLDEGSQLIIPAKLTKGGNQEGSGAGRSPAFQAVDCSGLARVDFLMDPKTAQRSILNEINTMPGFTSISMYPKLWAASGLEYADLIDRLIQLGIERHEDKRRINTKVSQS